MMAIDHLMCAGDKTLDQKRGIQMLVPAVGAVLFGIPAILLSVWFGRRVWTVYHQGGTGAVVTAWISVVGGLSLAVALAILSIGLNTGHSTWYNGVVLFLVLGCIGGLPTATTSLLVVRRIRLGGTERNRAIQEGALGALISAPVAAIIGSWVGGILW
jgi:hypothetical protein